ncbi:hypothetical protein [Rhodanobacter sp. Root561]|uniref:hypothetical protein n=1 Tax=Rhodanobacter sp. Root561 TaxID=1736560 RepID=UPI000AC19BA4|nr:hypothetical protein [Rhodanobacter sp. Root561]
MSKEPTEQQRCLGFCICIGVAIGCGLGIVFGNLALGIGPGIAIGIVFGIALGKKHAAKSGDGGGKDDAGGAYISFEADGCAAAQFQRQP